MAGYFKFNAPFECLVSFFFCTLVLYINILSALFHCVVVHKESCLKTPLPVNSIAQILTATHVEHQERALKIVLRVTGSKGIYKYF